MHPNTQRSWAAWLAVAVSSAMLVACGGGTSETVVSDSAALSKAQVPDSDPAAKAVTRLAHTIANGAQVGAYVRADGSVVASGVDVCVGPAWTGFDQPVVLLDQAAAVATTDCSVMVLRKDGSVWGGGFHLGQRGYLPASAGAMQHLVDGAIAISANHTSAYAVLADGTLLAADWSNWQLHPVLQNVVAVSAGYAHTMALTTDGTLYATGENHFGLQGVKNLAVGRSSDRWRVSMKKVVRFTANFDHSMALTKDGSLWLVGRINGGNAGHTTEQVWPQWTQIPAPAGTIVDLVPGYYYPTVRLADGTLVSPTIDAGNVNAGGLFLAPLTQVADASSVYDSGWLLKKDGSLWAAGYNVQGTWFSGGTVLGYTPTWTRIATGVAIGSP